MGLLFALVAIASWGLGDFLIQRSARKIGDWEALFFICLVGTVALFPFVYKTLAILTPFEWVVLSATSIIILVAALLEFDSLRVGKISVVEPVFAMEVIVTIALATFVLKERLSVPQMALIVALIVGIVLVSNRHFGGYTRRSIERGVWYAVLATIGMGTSNFLFGFGSREMDPLMINWFTSAFMGAATLGYLLFTGQLHRLSSHLRKHKTLIFAVGACDNLAWVAYSTSMLTLPIGLATGLTESYIALSAILGMTLNNEKLRTHQMIGLALSVTAAAILASTAA